MVFPAFRTVKETGARRNSLDFRRRGSDDPPPFSKEDPMLRYALALLVALPLAAAESKVTWKKTLDEALSEAKSSHKLVLVDFFAEG